MFKTFRSIYREKNDIITPEEIVALRKKYNISQKAFGRVLDIGDLTINSYEQGALPSGAHNSLLRLCEVEENFRLLFNRNKRKLSERQIRKVKEVLSGFSYPEGYDPLAWTGEECEEG